MFNRADQTYNLPEGIEERILGNEVSPLNRILQLIPDNVKVLDIGAGSGLLARILLKTRQNVIIDGVEPDSYAAELAKPFYRKVYIGYAQSFWNEISSETYDYIVLADVIEHISNPEDFLQELSSKISHRTRVLLSVPNVAFGAVRLSLLNGCFNYVDSGLLEKTHLRFFTRETLEKLISATEMNIEKLIFLQKDIFSTEIDVRRSGLNLFVYNTIVGDELASTYQFLLLLTKENLKAIEHEYFGKTNKSLGLFFLIKNLLIVPISKLKARVLSSR